MNYFVWKGTTKTKWSVVEANVKNNESYNNQIISVNPYSIKDNGVQKYVYGGLASSEEKLAEFKNLIHDCEFELITNTARDYNEAEVLLSEKVEKHDKYILVRSEYGSIESFQTSYAHLIRKYGNATIAIDSKNDMLSKFIENKTFTGSEENRTHNCSVIPTLFKLDKTTVKSCGTNLTFQLERIYDDNVVLKYLKKGAIFNAFLPYIGEDKSDTNTTYTFVDNSGNDISFVLPSQMSTRMLYLQLDEMQQGCIENTNSIISVVFNKDASESKGYTTFNNMTIDDFNQLQITDESDESIKTIYLYDGQMGYTFKFSCYTKNLPIPALSDGLFAYVDGSSLKTGKEKEAYGTGVVLSENNTVRFCHSEGVAKGSNFIGEIQAVTELLKELNDMPDADTTVRIFFDNTAVGYYPHGLFGWKEQKKDDEHKYVVAYKETLDKFVDNHPSIKLVFEHLDAHCKIFGNEFADRIAKVENTGVEDEEVVPGYFAKRKNICTSNGVFSGSFRIGSALKHVNEIYLDSVHDYDEENRFAFYAQGANPRILEKLRNYVDARKSEIKRIRVCMYLYNNRALSDYLLSLALDGIIVDVISIPLEGYDDNQAKHLLDYYTQITGEQSFTKYNLAQSVYNRMIDVSRECDNLHFYIFPHMYVRSSHMRSFSRGALPYSLHIKSMLFEYNNGAGAVALTSSNLSCRDLTKDELFFTIENNSNALNSARIFYDDLVENSIPASDFDEDGDWMHYDITIKDNPIVGVNTYIAPFYRNSPIKVREKIKELIRNAKKEIYISAEHLATESENDIIGCVFTDRRKAVRVNCLSQVFFCDDMNGFIKEGSGGRESYYFQNPNNNQRYEIRTPSNVKAFSNMTRNVDNDRNVSYCVNADVHAKYMVIDDVAVISTCNFTPTSFTYISEVDIPLFDNIPETSYHGTYSEVGQIIIIRDAQICTALKNNFANICAQSNTYRRS